MWSGDLSSCQEPLFHEIAFVAASDLSLCSEMSVVLLGVVSHSVSMLCLGMS